MEAEGTEAVLRAGHNSPLLPGDCSSSPSMSSYTCEFQFTFAYIAVQCSSKHISATQTAYLLLRSL